MSVAESFSRPGVRALVSVTLPRRAESASRARRLVADTLAAWGLTALTDAAVLTVTELVANAAEHSRGPAIRVTVSRMAEGRVRVDVIDKSRVPPAPRDAGPDDVEGRGLALVAAVSDTWGADALPWGKRVWAELEPER
ncbi:ATP-binding protein [Streptomyces sp. NPDC091292]|uniref:ATP-binding protein n=1 Tax=Streptomyces sp. NPDC091292 TaxID=3365991 RepID=UPI00380C39DD